MMSSSRKIFIVTGFENGVSCFSEREKLQNTISEFYEKNEFEIDNASEKLKNEELSDEEFYKLRMELLGSSAVINEFSDMIILRDELNEKCSEVYNSLREYKNVDKMMLFNAEDSYSHEYGYLYNIIKPNQIYTLTTEFISKIEKHLDEHNWHDSNLIEWLNEKLNEKILTV